MSLFLRADLDRLLPYTAEAVIEGDKLDANEIPYPLPAWFQEKLAYTLSGNRYPNSDPQRLRKLLGDYCQVTPEQITVGHGSDELIRSLIIASCLGQGRVVLSAEPTFSMYGIIAKTLGVTYRAVARQPQTFQLNLAALTTAIAQVRGGILFLASPNSPTGTPLNSEELAFLRKLPADLLVVLDEAYFEFSGQTVLPELPVNWVVLRTLSKAFRLAAYRVGYAAAAPLVIQALERVRLPYNLTLPSQMAAQLALEEREELLAVVPEIIEARDHLSAKLTQLQCHVWPSAGNFLYFRVPGQDLAVIHDRLIALGTLVRLTGGGLRLTVGTPAENHRFLERLAVVLTSV